MLKFYWHAMHCDGCGGTAFYNSLFHRLLNGDGLSRVTGAARAAAGLINASHAHLLARDEMSDLLQVPQQVFQSRVV